MGGFWWQIQPFPFKLGVKFPALSLLSGLCLVKLSVQAGAWAGFNPEALTQKTDAESAVPSSAALSSLSLLRSSMVPPQPTAPVPSSSLERRTALLFPVLQTQGRWRISQCPHVCWSSVAEVSGSPSKIVGKTTVHVMQVSSRFNLFVSLTVVSSPFLFCEFS